MPSHLEIIIVLTYVQLTVMEILIFLYIRRIKKWVDNVEKMIPGASIGKILKEWAIKLKGG